MKGHFIFPQSNSTALVQTKDNKINVQLLYRLRTAHHHSAHQILPSQNHPQRFLSQTAPHCPVPTKSHRTRHALLGRPTTGGIGPQGPDLGGKGKRPKRTERGRRAKTKPLQESERRMIFLLTAIRIRL